MSRDLNFVLKIASFISQNSRFPSSSHHLKVRDFLISYLRELVPVKTQKFKATLFKPIKGILEDGLNTYEGVPYTNSKSGKAEGLVVDCGYGTPGEIAALDLKGKIALVKEGKKPFRVKESLLKRKGAKGIIVYREDLEVVYNGVAQGLLPVISLPSFAKDFAGQVVKIYTETQKVNVQGENLWVEFGTYRNNLTLIAHYDTKPFTKGAIDNGLSVALLLWLVLQVAESKLKLPYRVRFLFTDLEEFGLLGAHSFVKSLGQEVKQTLAVSVDTVGWSSPAVLYKDAHGNNSLWLTEISEKILEFLGLRKYFLFTEGKSGRSDHIPFKKAGAKTLFFASNPFPFRHTELDSLSLIHI